MATNRSNGKEYVGQTTRSLNVRRNEHISEAINSKHNLHFYNAIRKYGPVNFDWEILHTCNNIDDLNKLEIYYIKLYDTFNNGYNLTLGGWNSEVSEETRKRMSKAKQGKNRKDHSMYGRENKWGNHTEETKQRMSISAKNRNPFSEETRNRMSISAKKRGVPTGKDSPSAKAVMIGDKHFDTLKEASIFLGRHPSTVRERIQHKTKWLDHKYVS